MCLFPVRAELQEFGKPKLDPEGSTILPCGKCFECKAKRAIDWGLRARHEISDHEDNCFITLTYDDENLPSFLIVKNEFQKFMKRLRKKLHYKVRYMVSHEYGGKTGRPHHHAIIFGWNPNKQTHLMDAPSGEPLNTSPELSQLWTNGFHSIGTANEKTAYYIAAYSLKSTSHSVTDPKSGELIKVTDSMDTSKRPAIGHDFFLRNVDQLLAVKTPLPRYYRKLLERHYPDKLEEYENNSMLDNLNPRSSHQVLAKYVITSQKQDASLGTFRSTPEIAQSKRLYKKHLEQNRDNYVHKLRKERENAT